MTKLIKFLLFALVIANSAIAGHQSGADLSWHLLSGGVDESRVAIYRKQEMLGIYNFSCDLTAAVEAETPSENATLRMVRPSSNPDGLLVVTCNIGAHSQMIAIVDPTVKTTQPAFARSGSYFVEWEIEDGELWISFDRACDEGPSVECPDGFETLFEQYPPQP